MTLSYSASINDCWRISASDWISLKINFKCKTSAGVVFRLAAKSRNGSMVWQNLKSGYFASAIFTAKFNQFEAEKICRQNDALDEKGGLTGTAWRLPSCYPSVDRKYYFGWKSDCVKFEEDGASQILYRNQVGEFHETWPLWTRSNSIRKKNSKTGFVIVPGVLYRQNESAILPRSDLLSFFCVGKR